MAKRKKWEGPFNVRYSGDTRCIKCDKEGVYHLSLEGFGFNACREHAVEALVSKEGGASSVESAQKRLDERDAEDLRRLNSRISRWELVTDSLPKRRKKVLTFDPSWPIVQVGYYDAGVWYCEGVEMTPTHWMELPEVPRMSLRPESVA
jgi:hypothetical protein